MITYPFHRRWLLCSKVKECNDQETEEVYMQNLFLSNRIMKRELKAPVAERLRAVFLNHSIISPLCQ